MDKKKLKEVLRLHDMWLRSEYGGKRAYLQRADLQGANLQGANLKGANLKGANLQGANLQRAYLQRADLQGANLKGAYLQRADLQGADLQRAYLQGADLQGADLDYSCWTLWCGSLDVKVDRRIAAQLAYHFCRLDCDDPDYINARNALMNFANSFHRVDECGRLR